MIHTAEQVLKKYPLRDSEIPIVLEDFLLKNFNIQEFVFSSLTLSYGLSRSWLYVSNFGVGFVRVLPCC